MNTNCQWLLGYSSMLVGIVSNKKITADCDTEGLRHRKVEVGK